MLKNRLEQFKKRQRDDALKATESGHRPAAEKQVTFGGDMQAEAGEYDDEDNQDADDEVDEDDWVEEYEPEMSPGPVETRDMTLDDRRLPIIDEEDHTRAIVSCLLHALITSDLAVRSPKSSCRIKQILQPSFESSSNAYDQICLSALSCGSRS